MLSSPRSRSWVRRILRRFRRNGRALAGGSGTPHAAMNLLPGHGAYTSTKEHGTRTPGTATGAECNFSPLLGPALEAHRVQIEYLRVSNCSGLGSYTVETATRGGNGQALGRADFTNRGGTDG